MEYDLNERDNYEKYIAERLLRYIDIIKCGISFFDVHAEIDDKYKNQVNFFDKDNKLISSQRFELPTDFEERNNALINASVGVLYFSFKTKEGYLINIKSSGKDNEYDSHQLQINYGPYTKHIELYRKENRLTALIAYITGQKDFGEKFLEIYDEDNFQILEFKLNNAYGPYRSNYYENGVQRDVRYYYQYDSPTKYNIDIIYSETFGGVNSLDPKYVQMGVTCSLNGNEGNTRSNATLSWAKINSYLNKAKSIIAHPRSKETIKYLENDLEREFPGIIDFINKNYELYKIMTNLDYLEDEELKDTEFIPMCNLLDIASKKLLLEKKDN